MNDMIALAMLILGLACMVINERIGPDAHSDKARRAIDPARLRARGKSAENIIATAAGPLKFNTIAARRAGYTPDEIVDLLVQVAVSGAPKAPGMAEEK
jgi:hypothetical protein